MIKRKNYLKLTLAVGVAATTLVILGDRGVFAADHAEAPGTQADAAADIADFYAWHTEGGTIVAVITFAGLTEAGGDPTYDPDVLYGVHIDTDNDNVADLDIWARFGQNMAGDWGLQVVDLPGADAAPDPDICGDAPGHCGPVDTVIDTGAGTMIWAGPREDPFFFDLQGYIETLDTGTVAFDSNNDSFAGTNVTAIVLEFDAAAALGGTQVFQTWATSSRL